MPLVLNETYVQSVLSGFFPDVEVILVEVAGPLSRRGVRVYIDHPDGVNHALCAAVSRTVEEAIERDEVCSAGYTIEVSSPGLDRPLRTPQHYAAQLGKRIKVRTSAPIAGRKAWDGVLVDSDAESIVIRQDGSEVRLELAHVARANLVYDFGQGARE